MGRHEAHQGRRKRDVNAQPDVKPAMQSPFEIKLPALVAQRGNPVDGRVGLGAKSRLELVEEFRGPARGVERRSSAGLRSQVRVDVLPVKRQQGSESATHTVSIPACTTLP